jgi:hypothetical protein
MSMPEITRKPLSFFKILPQFRTDLGSESELKNLGESLRVRQLSPVGALADGEMIYGFRRFHAASLVGMPDLLTMIYSTPLSKAELGCIQWTENFHRLDMSPYEKWHALEEIRKLNPLWTAKELGEFVKLDPSGVTKWLSPSRCIPGWQDALKAGRVGITDCYVAGQVSECEQQQLLDMKLGGASRDSLNQAVRRKKSSGKEDSVRSNRVVISLPSGCKLVVTGKSLSLSQVGDALSESLDATRKAIKERLDAKTFQDVMRVKCQSINEGDVDVQH